jgi:glutathione S-transferase
MPITLYAIPFSCSLATHVALKEAQLPHEVRWVARGTLRIEGEDGDLRRLNPKGKVATLVLEDGTVLTENVAVLAWVCERSGRRVDQPTLAWLTFIATELHKQVLSAWFDPLSPDATRKDVSQRLLPEVLKIPEGALERAAFLGGEQPSVADFYLFWGLLLVPRLGAELTPALARFRARMLERTAVAEAVSLERAKLKGAAS